MHSTDDFSEHLQRVGQRAATRPGPIAPPVDSIRVEVAQRQRRQRTIAGIAASVVLIALVPLAAFFLTRQAPNSEVVALAAETEAVAAETSSTQSPTTTQADALPLDGASNDSSTANSQAVVDDVDFEENVDAQITIGGRDYGLEVIVDEQARVRASAAEAAADETRTVGDNTIWLRSTGDSTEASTLIDGDTFIAANGPTDEVIEALDQLAQVEESLAPVLGEDFDVEGLLDEQFGEDFDVEEFFGDDFAPEQFFGDDFDPEQFFGDDFDVEEFFGEGFPFEGLENGEFSFDFERFAEGGIDFSELQRQFDSLTECFGPAFEEAEATGEFTLPSCDFAG